MYVSLDVVTQQQKKKGGGWSLISNMHPPTMSLAIKSFAQKMRVEGDVTWPVTLQNLLANPPCVWRGPGGLCGVVFVRKGVSVVLGEDNID